MSAEAEEEQTQEQSSNESPEATTTVNTETKQSVADRQTDSDVTDTVQSSGEEPNSSSADTSDPEPVDNQSQPPPSIPPEQAEQADQDPDPQDSEQQDGGTPQVAPTTDGVETSQVTDNQPEQAAVSEPEAVKEPENADTTVQEESVPTDNKQESTVETESKSIETSRPGTDQSTSSKKDKDRKEKKEKKKREKKKSRQASRDESKKKSAQVASGAKNHLEVILLSFFQTADLENSGQLDASTFWEILQSAELNLQLGPEEMARLQEVVEQDQSGLINYSEFSQQAGEMISSLYKDQPASEEHWVQLTAKNKSIAVLHNKQTGEARGLAEDLFGGVIENLFQVADVGNKGFLNQEEFANLLQSEQMAAYLSDEDILEMQQYFDNIPEGRASYTEFYPLGKEIILRVYRNKDPSESEWCQLESPQVGVFWFNKFTGETRKDTTDDRQQEIAFLNQAYAEVEAVNFELEQYKQQNKDLQNVLAQANEEQETLATQLYETGHHLDEANAEIEAKNIELDEARDIIKQKEQEIEHFLAQREEFEILRKKLEDTENELHLARETIATRDQTVAERDVNISDLQRTSEAITDKLKTVHGEVDAKDSTISSLKHKLNFQKMEAQKYEKQVTEYEEKLSSVEQELTITKQTLEEKTSALAQARKHLKNSRERTLELEKDNEKMGQAQEKLRSAECEIHTLKSFLTTKTAMIEKHKKDLRETRARVAELQEKDRRRAVILADVLEKTARQYQQQVGTSPGKPAHLDPTLTPVETRPASAPAFPPEGEDVIDGPEGEHSPSPRVMKSYTMSKGATASPFFGASSGRSPPQRRTGKAKPKRRSKTVPKLPPIHRAGQKQSSFVFPTPNQIRRQHWEQDQQVSDHVTLNPQCMCELCRTNMGPGTLRPETVVTAQTGWSGFQNDVDARELAMVRQLRNGQRVVVKMKKSEYDLEPQQLTGIIRYIGKRDSEFIDNRIYVGVKLDEAVGDTDGLIKGKRYFTCPAKHGKFVRITNIVAVLPNKSVFYKPLQSITKRSPYGGVAPKKSGTGGIKVV